LISLCSAALFASINAHGAGDFWWLNDSRSAFTPAAFAPNRERNSSLAIDGIDQSPS
jgi:hypothetical protein